MRQVRRSVFETNSSSSHSIVLTKKDHEITEKDLLTVNDDGLSCYRGIDLQEDGKWLFRGEDLVFGSYPFRILCTLKDKTAYAIASYCAYACADAPEQGLEKIAEIIKSVVPEFTGFAFEEKAPEGFDESTKPGTFYGWIDHLSNDLLVGVLQEAKISLREFLLNEKYWVIVNGDACEEFYDLVKTGIINRDILEKNYWAYDPLETDFFHKEDVDADDDLCSFFDDVRQ